MLLVILSSYFVDFLQKWIPVANKHFLFLFPVLCLKIYQSNYHFLCIISKNHLIYRINLKYIMVTITLRSLIDSRRAWLLYNLTLMPYVYLQKRAMSNILYWSHKMYHKNIYTIPKMILDENHPRRDLCYKIARIITMFL